MALILLTTNDNTFRISPVRRESDNVIETDVVFSVTLKDTNGDPVSGVSALSTAYRTNKKDNAVVFSGDDVDGLAEGSGYTIEAAATGDYADKITFEEIPVIAQKRRG